MQCNLSPAHLSFDVKKALSLPGQTTFQRLVGSSNITLSLRCHSRLMTMEKTNWCWDILKGIITLVSFVKCEPPSLLRGDKCYNAFKDVLAPICFFCCCQPGMAPQAEGYVGGPNKPVFEKCSDLEGKELSSQQTSR